MMYTPEFRLFDGGAWVTMVAMVGDRV